MAETTPQSNPPALAEELNSIAARAQTYTGASGAAIALSDGEVGEAVCRACSGPSAPDVGASIRLEGTFTGMAVQSGQALRCDDSETDRRVDAAACRALGTRSIVVVPIRDADTEAVAGVLAVFAGTKNAFNDLHVAVLRTMAREVAVAVQKARKAGIPLSTLGTTPIAQPAVARPVSDPGFTPPPMQPVIAPAPATPAFRPASASSASAAAAPKPAPEPAATVLTPTPMPAPRPFPPPPPAPKMQAPAPIREELIQPVAAPITPIATPIAPARRAPAPVASAPSAPEWKPAPPPPPRKVESQPRVEPPRPASTANFGTFDDVGQDKKPGGGGMGIWIGVAAAVVVVIGGYFAFTQFSGKSAEPPAQTAQQSAPASTSSSSSAPATQTTPPPATTTTTSTPPATQTSNQSSSQPANQPATQPAKGAASQAQSAPAQPKPAPAQPQQAPPQQQAKPSPQAVERAAVTPSSSPRQDAPPAPVAGPAPQIAVPISNSTPTLASPAAKVSQSTAATLLSQVAPKYPEMAKTMRAEGAVQLEATVGPDGAVRSVRALSGHSLLRDAASSAVKQWRYKPATLNGQPVESTVQITVKFTAPR